MQVSTLGLIIKEKKVSENDNMLTILTPEHGVVFARANGAKRIKGKMTSATEFLTYSKFELFKKNDFFVIDYAEPIELFYNLRCDLKKLSLASFFAQLTYFLTRQDEGTSGILKLLLNSLAFLQADKKTELFLKPVFEMRALVLSGFMPDLVCCANCAEIDPFDVNFNAKDGIIKCSNCIIDTERSFFQKISPDVFAAMRHIIYSDEKSLFNFKMSDDNLKKLGVITEKYMKLQMDINLPTLDFYKTIM